MEEHESQREVTSEEQTPESQHVEGQPDTAQSVKTMLALLGLVSPLPESQGLSSEARLTNIMEILQHSERTEKIANLQTLVQQAEAVYLPALHMALHDTDEAVRATAVGVIGALKEKVPLDLLLETLHDTAWYVRACTIHELGCQIERAPLLPLIEVLHDEDESVRAEAVWALGQLKEHAPEILLDTLHDHSWLVREAAEQILQERVAKAIENTSPGEEHQLIEFTSPLHKTTEIPTKLPDTGPLTKYTRLLKAKESRKRQNDQPDMVNSQSHQEQKTAKDQVIIPSSKLSKRRQKNFEGNKYIGNIGAAALVAVLLIGLLAGWYTLNPRFHTTSVASLGGLRCVLHPNSNDNSNVLTWSPDNSTNTERRLAVAGAEGTVEIYTAKLCQHLTTYHLARGTRILALKWLVDGLRLVTLTTSGNLQVIQENENNQSTLLLAINVLKYTSIPQVIWSKDGQKLAISLGGHTVQIWNIQKRSSISLASAYGQVSAIGWSPDNVDIAIAATDGLNNNPGIQIFSVVSKKTTAYDIPASDKVTALAWSADGQNLIFYERNNVLNRWNKETQSIFSLNPVTYTTLQQVAAFNTALAWSPDNTRIVVSTANGLQIWNALTAQMLGLIPGSEEGVQLNQLIWSSDDRYLADTSADGSVQVWTLGT